MKVDLETGIYYPEDPKEDKVVGKVIDTYKERSRAGIEKYGTTLDRDDLSLLEWLQHLQEELMDATLYIEAIKNKKENTGSRCTITGVELMDEDNYKNGTYPYANFVEDFRAKHHIPVSDLRQFVKTLKKRL